MLVQLALLLFKIRLHLANIYNTCCIVATNHVQALASLLFIHIVGTSALLALQNLHNVKQLQ